MASLRRIIELSAISEDNAASSEQTWSKLLQGFLDQLLVVLNLQVRGLTVVVLAQVVDEAEARVAVWAPLEVLQSNSADHGCAYGLGKQRYTSLRTLRTARLYIYWYRGSLLWRLLRCRRQLRWV